MRDVAQNYRCGQELLSIGKPIGAIDTMQFYRKNLVESVTSCRTKYGFKQCEQPRGCREIDPTHL